MIKSASVKFTKWKKLEDPLPQTTCFVRKTIGGGAKKPYLEFMATKEVPCFVCKGLGTIKKNSLEWRI